MSNVERRGVGFSFVERRASALRVLVSEGFGSRIISGEEYLVCERRVYIFNKKEINQI